MILPKSVQSAVPVVVSIIIILLIAFLRSRSRVAAVIVSTMPINVALGLWITYSGVDASPAVLTAFVRSLFWGLMATVLWLVVVFLVVRAGGGVGKAILFGYMSWAGLLAILFAAGILSVPSR